VTILELAKQAHGRCLNCGIAPEDPQILDPHHVKTRGSGGEDSLDNIAPLCHPCHRKAHNGRLVTQDGEILRGDQIKEFLYKRIQESLARNPARRRVL
jgi:5-methylcytosine-specific restriction endonuclease McrA